MIKEQCLIIYMANCDELSAISTAGLKSIEEVIDSKVINIYARPWVRLEPKLKLKKINEYLSIEENSVDEETRERIIKYYADKKKVVVKYDIETCTIVELKTHF